jgi:hypothetical protein
MQIPNQEGQFLRAVPLFHRCLQSIPEEKQDFHKKGMQIEGIGNILIVFSIQKRTELLDDRLPILSLPAASATTKRS